ncbi:MAG: hypothetical protein J7K26_02720 [Candidatus Aenigmarchaeota archaeon]|nr:hypothetical protein [Candidatus Aenigmarchaeota archaeon]
MIKRGETEEKQHFYLKLKQVQNRLEEVTLKKWMHPRQLFEETAKGFRKYFDYSVRNNKFIVSVRKNAVSHRVNRMGDSSFFTEGILGLSILVCFMGRRILLKGILGY